MGKNEYGLVADMLKQRKPKQPSEKKLMKKAFDFTSEFNECPKCGMTWGIDEADTCEDCEPEVVA